MRNACKFIEGSIKDDEDIVVYGCFGWRQQLMIMIDLNNFMEKFD